ncbi:AAA family ATPase [Marinobacter sp.]|uniref:AAA family ATPase n=1 Tax=Marinobacter sp. TaxID=50741 RepID=UPI00384CB873
MEIILFMGIQASGKTTFYLERFFATHIRLNLDMLRTRRRERVLLEACLDAQANAVIDNTNPARSDRQRYFEMLAEQDVRVTGYYFRSSLEECSERNARREGKAKIPEAGLRNTLGRLELPSFDEGFDELYYVSLTKDGFDVQPWRSEA